ncbi:MAG: chemotaxis protein CheA [Candidatus Omnitrophica bacterium]|nr:chemotaxis protein CheA [Candidatus Omnitrophota bacterium]MCM8826211.1 chemotaxis protein CheA [Candidatus Omnitrophota bacterium]
MDKNYWELFFAESEEYLRQINNCLVKLEEDYSHREALNEIFRLMHTIKGMSATMGFNELAEFSHAIEDVFEILRSGKQKITQEIMDTIFSCIDAFAILLEESKAKKEISIDVKDYICRIRNIINKREELTEDLSLQGDLTEIDVTPQEAEILGRKIEEGWDIYKLKIKLVSECLMKGARAFLVIVRLKKMGEVIKIVPPEEELKKGNFSIYFVVILATKEEEKVIYDELSQISELEEIKITPFSVIPRKESKIKSPITTSYFKKIQSIRIPVERLDKVMNYVGELSIAKSRLLEVINLNDKSPLEGTVSLIERLISFLQDEVLQLRLLPISYILDAFPRIVRDLVKRSDKPKSVDIEIKGSEIELDRVILDELGDILIHILRNAIDHGIEDEQTREKLGKNRKGKITINVSREKGQVTVEIMDDGKGIDFNEIAKKALEKGIISEKEATSLDAQKVLDIITMPSFSTSTKVSDISGRGVGLDMVKVKLDALGGRLNFESELGKGTKFIITLPLTLAIVKAMLVEVEQEIFAIPLMSIRESIKIEGGEIKTIQNMDVIRLRNEIIPLIWLGRELAIKEREELNNRLSVVVVEGKNKSLGLVVDKIIGEQDIVVKPLGNIVKKVKGFSGATILGNGKVALILDMVNLL